jgi:competence protein ComEC
VLVSLDEPLVEKAKSFKANATVNYLIRDNRVIRVKGKIIVYFKKDSSAEMRAIDYGSQIIFNRALQEIRNSGNPGAFDFKRYSLFQGITHQVFLQPAEFIQLKERNTNVYQRIFYPARQEVLDILRANINGPKELGLAEALLVGYKNDLDKTLVQSYSNTGVVHVIAISGLHIGLIYWVLLLLFRPLRTLKHANWLQPFLVIAGLWGFSLLAGGQPSVLRSAVMFTCIVAAQSFARQSSIFNTLAFSAFVLLCYNPYWLWDAGFQLSYSAVLSIVIFMKPIYNWFYVKNKILDHVWKLNAVTLAAQILTLPVSIYHFHQFPNYFMLANIVAVPLSSIIVLGEILLCSVCFISSVAQPVGTILSWLIRQMNIYVERIEALPGALLDGLMINMTQVVLLVIFITGISCWLMEKIKRGLVIAIVSLAVFGIIKALFFFQVLGQKKIIVYNLSQYTAIDFIEGNKYFFYGDSALVADDFSQNFHLKPARIINRISPASQLNELAVDEGFASFGTHKIMMIKKSVQFHNTADKPVIDLVVISGSPKLYIPKLADALSVKQLVFDGSVSSWKIGRWKRDCDSLHIPYYDVKEKGAFVMTLN